MEYDSAGRPVETTSPEIKMPLEASTGVYATTVTEYDANGNVWKVTPANGNDSEVTDSIKYTTTTEYDFLKGAMGDGMSGAF